MVRLWLSYLAGVAEVQHTTSEQRSTDTGHSHDNMSDWTVLFLLDPSYCTPLALVLIAVTSSLKAERILFAVVVVVPQSMMNIKIRPRRYYWHRISSAVKVDQGPCCQSPAAEPVLGKMYSKSLQRATGLAWFTLPGGILHTENP
jgi:hypothetical protein